MRMNKQMPPLRPISLLRLSLLRFVDTTGSQELPPLKIETLLKSKPLKSRIIVRPINHNEGRFARELLLLSPRCLEP